MRTVQPPLFTPETEWVMPDELKDLTQYKEIAVDLETNDPQLTTLGAGNVVGRGHIAGVALAVEGSFPLYNKFCKRGTAWRMEIRFVK